MEGRTFLYVFRVCGKYRRGGCGHSCNTGRPDHHDNYDYSYAVLTVPGRRVSQKLTCHIPGLVISTWVLTFLLSFFAADPYLAMIIPANVWGQCYDEQGLRRSVLSRTLEDGGTIICPMVPWGTNGIYCSATLGVAVSSYLPYYFLGLLTPAAMLFCALSGFGIKKIKGGTYDSSRE